MVRDGMCGVSVDALKVAVAISNLYHVIVGPLLAHMPNLIQIGQKTQKLEIFTFGQLWLVGLVGQKLVVGISNSFYVVFAPLLAPIPNFIQIGQKNTEVRNFHFW